MAQQLGRLLAQRQQLLHQGAVVALDRAELAGARDVGGVHQLAQAAVAGVLHDRPVHRVVQRQQVTQLPLRARGFARGLQNVGRHPVEVVWTGQVGETVGGVEHMLAVLLFNFGGALLDLDEARLGLTLQFSAREHEVAQGVGQGLAPGRGQRRSCRAGRNRLVLGIEPLVATEPGVEFGHRGQAVVVRSTQCRRVGHGVEVRHRAPGPPEALCGDIEHGRQGLVLGWDREAHGLIQRLVGLCQQRVDGRRHMFGTDRVEVR